MDWSELIRVIYIQDSEIYTSEDVTKALNENYAHKKINVLINSESKSKHNEFKAIICGDVLWNDNDLNIKITKDIGKALEKKHKEEEEKHHLKEIITTL